MGPFTKGTRASGQLASPLFSEKRAGEIFSEIFRIFRSAGTEFGGVLNIYTLRYLIY
ncbi:Uncharacterized protein dnm_086820 [Desulfonema magnum]|uniref:Uncharacterized protein n=1 Tax=Desulfonema magnum TaxID=45655 RepID=A0A975BW56_9BACT|nr:Uncharacterized protein dnm_086820 [Desulfonema magnum]